MPRIQVTPEISLDEAQLEETFLRASGPGGQNIQKVETAVQLRFDMRGSTLPGDVQVRLAALAGRRLTMAGVLVIEAQRFRLREQNRKDALARLVALIRSAAAPPAPVRVPTKPTKGARRRRVQHKAERAEVKRLRRSPELE